MNSFNETIDLENEVRTLNERLNMYKSLNTDLSGRIQDLKLQVGSYASELNIVRRELLAEKARTSEMRRYIKLLNTQCASFFNTFVSNVQQAADNGIDINISTLGLGGEDDRVEEEDCQDLRSSDKFTKRISTIKERIQSSRSDNMPNDCTNSPNNFLLNTIAEEQSQMLATSTPVVFKIPPENDETSFNKIHRSSRRSSSIVIVAQTPQKDSKRRTSTSKTIPIFEDESCLQKALPPCYVRISRCPLAEKKSSNVREPSVEEKTCESDENESKVHDLPPRPKRSKRPRSGSLIEPSTRSKLRRT